MTSTAIAEMFRKVVCYATRFIPGLQMLDEKLQQHMHVEMEKLDTFLLQHYALLCQACWLTGELSEEVDTCTGQDCLAASNCGCKHLA